MDHHISKRAHLPLRSSDWRPRRKLIEHSTMMARKLPKQDNPEQSKRFIDMAREIGVDESPEAFDRAFKKVIRSEPSDSRPNPSSKPSSAAARKVHPK